MVTKTPIRFYSSVSFFLLAQGVGKMKNKFLIAISILFLTVPVTAHYVMINTDQSCPLGGTWMLSGTFVNSSDGSGLANKTVNVSFRYSNGTVIPADIGNIAFILETDNDGKFQFESGTLNCSAFYNAEGVVFGTYGWNITAGVNENETVTQSGFFDLVEVGVINSTTVNGSGVFSPGDTVLVTGKAYYVNGTALSTVIDYALFKGNGMQILSGNTTSAVDGSFNLTLGPIPSDADGGIYFLNIGNATKSEVSFIIKPMNVHVELKNVQGIKTDTFKSNSNITVEVSATSSSGNPVNGTVKLEIFFTNGTIHPWGSATTSIDGYAEFEDQPLSGISSGEYRLRVSVTSDTGVKSVNEIPMFIGDYDLQVHPYADADGFFNWGKYKGFGKGNTAVLLVELFDMQNSTPLNSSYFYCNSTHIPLVNVQAMNGTTVINSSLVNTHVITDKFGEQHCTINFTADMPKGRYRVRVQENMTGQELTSNTKLGIFEILLTGGSLGDDFKSKAWFTPNQQFPLKLSAFNASNQTDITDAISAVNITKMFKDDGTELNPNNHIVSNFSNGKMILTAPSEVGTYSLKFQATVTGQSITGDAMFVVKNFMVFGGSPPINTDSESFTIYGEAFDMDFNMLSDVVIGVQSVISEKDGQNWTDCINTSLSSRTSDTSPAMIPIVKTCDEEWDIGFYEVVFWAKRTVTVGNTTTIVNETGFGGFPVLNYWVNVVPVQHMVKPSGNITFNISVVRINSSSEFFDPFMGDGPSGQSLAGFKAIPRLVSVALPGMEEDRDFIELINPPNCTTSQVGNGSMCQLTIDGSNFPKGVIPTGHLDLEVEAYNASNPSNRAFGFGFFESTPYKVKISGMLWEGQPIFDPMENPLIEGGNVSIRLNAFEQLYSGGNISKGFMGTPYSTRLTNITFKAIRDAWNWQDTGVRPSVYSLSTISIVNGTYWLNFTVPNGLPGKGEYLIEMEIIDINGKTSMFDVFAVITPFGYTIAPARVVWAEDAEYNANGTEQWSEHHVMMNSTTLLRIENATGVSSTSGTYRASQMNASGLLIDFVLVDNNTNAPGKYMTVLARDHNMASNFSVISTGDQVSALAPIYFWEMKEKSDNEFWVVSNQTVSEHGDCGREWCVPWFGIHPVDTNFTLPLKIYGLNNQPLQANVSLYKILSGWTWPPVDKTSAITSDSKYPGATTTNAAGIAFLTVSANDTGHYIPLFNISASGKQPETADMETSWRFDFEIKHFVGWMDRFKNPRTGLIYTNGTYNNSKQVNMSLWGNPPNSTGWPGNWNITGLPMWFGNSTVEWDWSGDGAEMMSLAYFYRTDPWMRANEPEYQEWLLVMDNDHNMNETYDMQFDENDPNDGFSTVITSLEWDNRIRKKNSEKELLIAYLQNLSATTMEIGIGDVGWDEEFWQWNNSNENISAALRVSKFNGESLNGSNVSIQVTTECYGPSKSGGDCGGDFTDNVTYIVNTFDSSQTTNASYLNTQGNWQVIDGSTFFTIIPPQNGWPEGVGGGEVRVKLTVQDDSLGKTDTFNMNIHKEGEHHEPGGPM